VYKDQLSVSLQTSSSSLKQKSFFIGGLSSNLVLIVVIVRFMINFYPYTFFTQLDPFSFKLVFPFFFF